MTIAKRVYQFSLILKNVDEKTPDLEDSLYQSGCDDALINFRNGTVYLDFDREATTLEQAIIKAIHDVESSSIGAIVASVGPEDFVTESDIAKRLKTSRQSVSLWITGTRRSSKLFPKPIMKLSDRSPLWKWSEVTDWLYENKIITDGTIVKNAVFFGILNKALEDRNEKFKKIRRELLKKVGRIRSSYKDTNSKKPPRTKQKNYHYPHG